MDSTRADELIAFTEQAERAAETFSKACAALAAELELVADSAALAKQNPKRLMLAFRKGEYEGQRARTELLVFHKILSQMRDRAAAHEQEEAENPGLPFPNGTGGAAGGVRGTAAATATGIFCTSCGEEVESVVNGICRPCRQEARARRTTAAEPAPSPA
ncbi:MAG TPA: hypothetical protein VF406_13985 [Thermodesulfobacteriota bacterium]